GPVENFFRALRLCLVRFQGFQGVGGVLDELIDERRLAVDELLDLFFREAAGGQRLHKRSAFASAREKSILLKQEIKFSGSEGIQMPLEGGNKDAYRLQRPSTIAVWTARAPSSLGSTTRRCLPFVVRVGGASPPDLLLGAGYELIGRKTVVLGRVPLGGNVGEEGGKGVGDRGLLASTERTATAVGRPVRCRRLPFVVRAICAFPPELFLRFG